MVIWGSLGTGLASRGSAAEMPRRPNRSAREAGEVEGDVVVVCRVVYGDVPRLVAVAEVGQDSAEASVDDLVGGMPDLMAGGRVELDAEPERFGRVGVAGAGVRAVGAAGRLQVCG